MLVSACYSCQRDKGGSMDFGFSEDQELLRDFLAEIS